MRAELLNLTGMLDVKYHAEEDLFTVRYESVLLTLAAISAAVVLAGKKMGRDFAPEVVA